MCIRDSTHALMTPRDRTFGAWRSAGDLPPTLTALLVETVRHYLPWVAEATTQGAATVRFGDGIETRIETTPFLTTARGIMLARYVAARSRALDALLERAGILRYFADYTRQATTIPDPTPPPRPSDNQPFRAGP